MITLKSPAEIALMRQAGRILVAALEDVKKAIAPGVTTKTLDEVAARSIKSRGGYPAFLGYQGFPANICTSVNDEVVHGIPDERVLQEGDIVSVDLGVVYQGYYADAAWTFPVGAVSAEAERLMSVTQQSLWRGIAQARAGNHLSDISHAIQEYVEQNGFSVVREYVGHGIGTRMHEEPQVPNFGPPGRGIVLREGMCLAIEPMVNVGTWEVKQLANGWTVVTKDHRLSAHFEHTIAVTAAGPVVLTSA